MLGSAPSPRQRAMPNRNVGRCTHNGRVSGPATRRSSAGRTARASVEVWSLTVVAHTVAGGALPSLPWLVGVAGLVTVSTAWVLRRSVRLAVMLPVLVLCQLGLHALFATLSPAGAAVGHAPGHAQHAAAPSSVVDGGAVAADGGRTRAVRAADGAWSGGCGAGSSTWCSALAGRWRSRCGRPRSPWSRGRRSAPPSSGWSGARGAHRRAPPCLPESSPTGSGTRVPSQTSSESPKGSPDVSAYPDAPGRRTPRARRRRPRRRRPGQRPRHHLRLDHCGRRVHRADA